MASISTRMVSSYIWVTNVLPNVFLIACFIRSTILSQKPPYHGARLGIKCQVTLWHSNASFSASDLNNLCRSSAAAKNVETLSDIMVEGRDFQLEIFERLSKMFLLSSQ